jgi:bifunctional N-acetylglucosamine-1-phosphate-uridyltransferase/glucosamine-1-phosphate-acetyltransferase GlmU-like protein
MLEEKQNEHQEPKKKTRLNTTVIQWKNNKLTPIIKKIENDTKKKYFTTSSV